jgi:hypothetical protein
MTSNVTKVSGTGSLLKVKIVDITTDLYENRIESIELQF